MVNNKSVKKKAKEDIFVSVVIATTSDEVDLSGYIRELSVMLAERYTNYEIILVDNGTDRTVIEAVTGLLDQVPCVRVISLSQRQKYDTAIFAGLDSAIGDFVCTLNPAVDPINEVPEIISENQQVDAVQGVSKTPIKSVFGGQAGRRLFYWYNRHYIDIDIPVNATYFASYNRAVVNAVTATSRNHRHIRHLVRSIGYRPVLFYYEPTGNPASQRTLKTGVVEALEIAASYSTHPLRFVTWLGFLAGIINVLYVVYILIVNLTNKHITEGWTTTSLQLSSMFFILFAIMVILAEYVGRILVESRREPQYYIKNEESSSVGLADKSRRNIER